MPDISTSSAITSFLVSGVSTIDPLLDETHIKWDTKPLSPLALTFSFPWAYGASASWKSSYSSSSEPQAATHSGLNDTQISAATKALQAWANVANVSFTQVADTATNVGDFRFAFSSAVTGDWGWCYYPGSAAAAADIWINPTYATSTDWSAGSYNYDALIHEIGHGLGLKHPGNYSGGGTPPYLPANLDYRTYTIMSYNDLNTWFLDTAHNKYIQVVPETPMVYDILAIQYLYGANYNYHTTNDTYTFNPSHPFYIAIWDAGGTDTIDVSNFSTNCIIDLTPGHYSSILYINQGTTANLYTGTNNLGIAFGAVIENATGGTGNDTFIGNSANNLLNGGGGTNTAVESGNYAEYRITYNAANHQYTVTDKVANRDGVDTLSNMQQIQFADGIKTLSSLISPPTVVMPSSIQGFDQTWYLDAKLAALQSNPATSAAWANRASNDVLIAFTNAGLTPVQHYEQFGWTEALAPNQFFNATEYSSAKATQLYNIGGYSSIADAESAYSKAWTGDQYQHYLQHGDAEEINPSNAFDVALYYQEKLTQLQNSGSQYYSAAWTGKSVSDLESYFHNNAMTALGHYELYGIAEGLTPIAVPLAQQAAPTPYITLVGVTDLTPA